MKLLYFNRAVSDNIFRSVSRGFTLIEILVTLVIVSVAVLSLGHFTVSMLGIGQTSRERLAAVHMAEQVLEFWQHDANDYAPTISTTDCSLSASASAPAYNVSVTCTPASGPSSSFTVVNNQVQATGPIVSDLSAFQNFTKQGYNNTPQTKVVTVSWTYRGKVHSVHLTHLSEVK